MFRTIPSCLITLLVSHLQTVFAAHDLQARGHLNTGPDGSTFLWLPQDEYSGPSFFECVRHSFSQVMNS